MAFDKGYALVIGIGSYVHIPQANIPISVTDARAVRDLLQDPKLCGYPPKQITLLHDDMATRTGILEALEELSSNTTEENTVLLYYVGHGDYGTDGNYYLTTNDTKILGNKVLKETGISEAELLDKLRTIPAKRLLLMFNSCHSGEISPTLGLEEQQQVFGASGLPSTATDALLSAGEGRIIITASRPDQKSWIGSGQLSIFTQAVVDGLSGRGSVVNNNGYISAFTLYEHIYMAVKDSAVQLGKTQEPELTVLKGIGPFPVSLFRGATDLGTFDTQAPLPEETAIRIVEPIRSQRLFEHAIKNVIASGESVSVVGGDVVNSTIITGGFYQPNMQVGGNLYQAANDMYIAQGSTNEGIEALRKIFADLLDRTESIPVADQAIVKPIIKQTQEQVEKIQQGDESIESLNFLQQRLKNLVLMAPDIGEVAIATLVSPPVGVALAIKKIAEKVQKELPR